MSKERRGWGIVIQNEIELAREKKEEKERKRKEKEALDKILEDAKKLDW